MGKRKKQVGIYLLITACSICFLYPAIVTLMRSFGVGEEGRMSLEGYLAILVKERWFLPGFWNSVCYAVVTTVVNGLISLGAACAFRFTQFRGQKLLYFFYIVLMMMPLQVTLLPNYIGLREMGLLDTRWALILPGCFAPFSVFFLCQYMRGIDTTQMEAAFLETNSLVAVLTQVVLPQIKPCIFAVLLFVFAENWSMVEQADIFLKGEDKLPLTILLTMTEKADGFVLYAGSVIFMIPVVLLYLHFSDSLEEGVGSIKL